MSIQDVVVNPRVGIGKEESKRLRRTGLIPSVVYGMGADPVSVSVEPKTITTILRSEKGLNSVLNLRLDGTEESRHVMIKTMDRHPVTDRLIHIDFMRIDMEKEIDAVIPIQVLGTPAGVTLGGILTIVRHEVEITCLPKDLPGKIQVDLSELGLDEACRIKDLPQMDGVQYKLGPQRMIAVVHPQEKETVIEEDEEEEAL